MRELSGRMDLQGEGNLEGLVCASLQVAPFHGQAKLAVRRAALCGATIAEHLHQIKRPACGVWVRRHRLLKSFREGERIQVGVPSDATLQRCIGRMTEG